MAGFASVLKIVVIGSLIVTTNVQAMPALADLAPANVATRDGCTNYWMFNGVWRIRVTDVSPFIDTVVNKQTGWRITEQWRNGTTQTLSPNDSWVWSQRIALANGTTLNADDTTTGALSEQTVDYHQFPPSAQFTQTQVFLVPNIDPNNKPQVLVIAFDANKLRQFSAKPQFSVSPPNYRIKLDCGPTENARAAAAQGGSLEVAAHEGCLNQYISNGLYRVRVSNLASSIHDNQQVGWQVTEDWTNQTGRKISMAVTAMQDQQLALKNEDTVSSGNAVTTTLALQKLAYYEFSPGGSFTQVQAFWPNAPFDATNTPTKLLLMFDAKALARNTSMPQFKGPGNIRVDLTCSK